MTPYSWRLGGGLDLTTPRLGRSRRAGYLSGGINYESRAEGYRRIDGYERFDGRKSPSDTLEDEPGEEEEQTKMRRAAIQEVPGVGDILGVWRYQENCYAFRKDSAGIAKMYKSSKSSGWAEIDLGYRVRFTAGSGDAPEADDSIANSSSVEATVIGVHLVSGTWAGGDAAGILVLAYEGATRFAEADSITVESEVTRTFIVSAVPVKQAVGTGTQYEFLNYNFFGQAARERMYGVTGAGNPFEFDGTMFLELETGVTSASPTHIVAHKRYLFVGYEQGSVINSEVGEPREWTADGGALETAIGDLLTGMLSGFRDTLFIFGRNKTARLRGDVSSNAPWVLDTVSEEAGAMAHTAQLMDEPVCLDDRGVRTISTTQAFGDFDIGTISDRIRPLLDNKRDGSIQPVASVRVRRKSQYRVFFSDGSVLVGTYVRRGPHVAVEFTSSQYPLYGSDGLPVLGIVRSVCSVEDNDGRERIFCTLRGSDYVYEMDRGDSFDGQPIQSYLRLPYNDFGSPETAKRYRKLLIECSSSFVSEFHVAADYDDGSNLGVQPKKPLTVVGPGSVWGEYNWGKFYWAGKPRQTASSRLRGYGRNISVLLYSGRFDVQPPHIFTGLTVLFEPRKIIQ